MAKRMFDNDFLRDPTFLEQEHSTQLLYVRMVTFSASVGLTGYSKRTLEREFGAEAIKVVAQEGWVKIDEEHKVYYVPTYTSSNKNMFSNSNVIPDYPAALVKYSGSVLAAEMWDQLCSVPKKTHDLIDMLTKFQKDYPDIVEGFEKNLGKAITVIQAPLPVVTKKQPQAQAVTEETLPDEVEEVPAAEDESEEDTDARLQAEAEGLIETYEVTYDAETETVLIGGINILAKAVHSDKINHLCNKYGRYWWLILEKKS